jgi:hypothetical protein
MQQIQNAAATIARPTNARRRRCLLKALVAKLRRDAIRFDFTFSFNI